MISNRLLAASVAAALAVGAGSAAAAPYYSAQISGSVVDENGVASSIGQGHVVSTTPVQFGKGATDWSVGAEALATHGGTAESDIEMGPAPTQTGVGYALSLTSQSQVILDLTLDGTASDPFVPVTIGTKGIAVWTQNGDAEATFDFSGDNIATIHREVSDSDGLEPRLAGTEDFKVNTIVDMVPGVTYQVVLFTFVSSVINEFQANPDGTFSFGEDTAVVDPTFTVDPAFASRWTIDGIPVDTSGGVPEPSAWALLISGFGLAGTSLRRRRALAA